MKKRIVQVLLTAVLVSSMAVTPVLATPSVEDMKDDKAAAEGEVSSLQSELEGILGKIDTLEADLKDKQEEVEKTNIDLEESIQQQREQYEDMKKRIQFMYESGEGSGLEILLSAESFSDFVNKAEYIRNVHDYDKEKQREYAETTEKIEKISNSLQKEVESMVEIQTELEDDKESLNTLIAGKQEEIAKLDADIQEAVEAQQRAAEEARRQEEAQREEQNSGGGDSGRGDGGSGGSSDKGDSGSSGGSSVVPPQGQDGWAVVQYARQFLGNPYVYGGNSLTNGTDCSGFTKLIYAAFGVTIGRTDALQAYAGVEVPLSEAQAGDLLVYYGHVGIYNGTGGIIHASSPEVGIVEWPSCTYRQLRCVRRVL